MDNLIKEIGSYNILNNLLPGAVYTFYIYIFADINYMNVNIAVLLFVMYFEGLFISRIGSLLEPYVIRIFKLETRDYTSYVKAEKNDSKIQILQRDANTYRSLISMHVLVFVSIVILKPCSISLPFIAIMVAGILVFACSYAKQYKFIISRLDIEIERMNKNKNQ